MQVSFTHPRKFESYLAEISPKLSPDEILEVLTSAETGPFLSALKRGQFYALRYPHSQEMIPKNMTMGDAGVVDGDMLDVLLGAYAAGWVEILAISASVASVTQVILMVIDMWTRTAKKKSDETKAGTIKKSKAWDEVEEILIHMNDGSWVSFEAWKDDPEEVKSFIQVFEFASASPKPKEVIFALKKSRRIRIDISDRLIGQKELDELIRSLKL